MSTGRWWPLGVAAVLLLMTVTVASAVDDERIAQAAPGASATTAVSAADVGYSGNILAN